MTWTKCACISKRAKWGTTRERERGCKGKIGQGRLISQHDWLISLSRVMDVWYMTMNCGYIRVIHLRLLRVVWYRDVDLKRRVRWAYAGRWLRGAYTG